MEYSQKITEAQLKRKAVLYVRQSTMTQVYENVESTMRQYALKEKLIQLGWTPESIITIDCDLGRSGSGSMEREGFKKLVADVSNDEVGAVACLEMSRLARNSRDWGRLMEICTITKTALIDSDGIYDLSAFNDRMLLGFKGTMSEAELHFFRSRMREGALNKAKRGELRATLPIGYVYDEAGHVVKDPNIEVQSAVNMFFEAFRICGSSHKVVRHYSENGFKIPRDPTRGHNSKELVWKKLSSSSVLDMLHNPAYAGIYAYGQRQKVATINGSKSKVKPVDEWHVCLKDHHEGYISEEEFNRNQAKLLMNSTLTSPVPPTREGSALLQGVAICGVCGKKMRTWYRSASRENTPYYICDDVARHYSGDRCQYVHGAEIDKAISNLILERLTPLAITNALKVQEEVIRRESAANDYFAMQVERARYEVGLAKKRYMNVDPSNRLVAFELEKIWNQKITELSKAEEDLRVHENAMGKTSAQPDIAELMSLPDNVRDVWNNGNVQIKDKKRILRCLIEDVTITKKDRTVDLGVRFKTGATAVAECQIPPMVYDNYATSAEVVDIVRRESSIHTTEIIAEILKEGGYLSGKGIPISIRRVEYIMRAYNIKSLKEHLKARGYLTAIEKADQLNIEYRALHKMKNEGKLDCEYVKINSKGTYMFAP